MSFWHQIIAALAGAAPVLIGTVLGLAGGVFATIHAQNRQSKREKFKELRSNLHTVVLESKKISAWMSYIGILSSYCTVREFTNADGKEPIPTETIRVFASFYFPEICDAAENLWSAAHQYRKDSLDLVKIRHPENPKTLTKKQFSDLQDKQIVVLGKSMEKVVRAQKNFEKVAEKLMTNLLNEKLSQR